MASKEEILAGLAEIVNEETGLDPAEVRRRNLVPRFTAPYTTGAGTTYDVGDYPAALERAPEHSGYGELRAQQADRRRRATTCLLGVGLGTYVEITAGGE